MARPIYMDHHATTPVLPEVLEAMLPYLREEFGNASSSSHVYGKAAADAVEAARRRVAELIGARPAEIVFTSGATESDNLALRGATLANRDRGDHLVTCVIEHEAVLETIRGLEHEGFRATYLPVDPDGLVEPASVLRAITDRTILVSIQAANNEIGTVQALAEIGRITREKGVILHTDAAQAVGRIPVNVEEMGVDLLAASAHKMHGPKGVGFLYVRRGVRIQPQVAGGGQEKKRRSGTLNVPGIAGLGAAAEIARRDLPREMERLAALRDRLWRRIASGLDHARLNGHPARRLPGNLNVSFRFVDADAILTALRDVAALSSGAACASGTIRGSYVVRALGVDEEDSQSTIRFGLGRANTEQDVDVVADHVIRAVTRLRDLSPLHAGGAGRAAGAPAAGSGGER
jgi:cysteine desulfurase